MDTGTIIAIAVAALVVIALIAFVVSRNSDKRQFEREVERRRDQKVSEHRSEAEEKAYEAERLEAAARAQRAEADAHAERASMHERGLADDQLHREVEADQSAGDTDRVTTHDRDADPDSGRFAARDTTANVDRDGAPIEPQRRI
jgi:FtsZ-interacting cell division protein ZipA